MHASKRLEDAMQRAGLSDADLAEKLFVNERTIRRLRRPGKTDRGPNSHQLSDLDDVFPGQGVMSWWTDIPPELVLSSGKSDLPSGNNDDFDSDSYQGTGRGRLRRHWKILLLVGVICVFSLVLTTIIANKKAGTCTAQPTIQLPETTSMPTVDVAVITPCPPPAGTHRIMAVEVENVGIPPHELFYLDWPVPDNQLTTRFQLNVARNSEPKIGRRLYVLELTRDQETEIRTVSGESDDGGLWGDEAASAIVQYVVSNTAHHIWTG